MKLEDYHRELQHDPEYIEAEEDLRPFLDLADEILELRLERDWSQSELARRAGTKQANISRIESGLANPTVKFLQKLARAFGAELEIHFRSQQPVERPKVIYVPVKTDLPWRPRKSDRIAWDMLSSADLTVWPRGG